MTCCYKRTMLCLDCNINSKCDNHVSLITGMTYILCFQLVISCLTYTGRQLVYLYIHSYCKDSNFAGNYYISKCFTIHQLQKFHYIQEQRFRNSSCQVLFFLFQKTFYIYLYLHLQFVSVCPTDLLEVFMGSIFQANIFFK